MTHRWRFVLAAILAVLQGTAHAQSSDSGPIATAGGSLQFVREGAAYVAQIDERAFDRLNASRLQHFDDLSGPRETVARMLVESNDGVVLYDFRRNPPALERIGRRLKLVGVYWQGDEVVLKSTEGWYKYQRGTLTKLKSSKTIYH